MTIFNSIKARLVLWIFAFISLLLVVIGASVFYNVKQAIFTSIDNSLDSKIEIVAGLLHFEEGKAEFELSEYISGEYAVPRSGRYYKVVIDGKVFAASPSLMNNEYDLTSGKTDIVKGSAGNLAYTAVGPGRERIRVMQHDLEFVGKQATVFLGESIEQSLSAIDRIKLFLLITIPASILIAGLISLWIITRSLMPLTLFSNAVSRITHKNLNERVMAGHHTSELSSLAGSFNAMLDRLQNAFETEKRIISDASHELKTPLTVIKAQCDVILQRSRTAEEYIEAISTIRTSGDSMSRLVNDLLSLARLDSGMLSSAEFKEVPLKICLEDAVRMVKVPAEKKDIRLTSSYSEDINVTGIKERLTEAFLNIIENAVRYNRPGGSVDIRLSGKNNYAEVVIKDTGPGIEADDLKRIYERFYRADQARTSGGTGLGLSIAKAIIEAHGGIIKAESKKGEGCSFYINIPLSRNVSA